MEKQSFECRDELLQNAPLEILYSQDYDEERKSKTFFQIPFLNLKLLIDSAIDECNSSLVEKLDFDCQEKSLKMPLFWNRWLIGYWCQERKRSISNRKVQSKQALHLDIDGRNEADSFGDMWNWNSS